MRSSEVVRQHRVERAKELIRRGHYDRADVQDRRDEIVFAEIFRQNRFASPPDPTPIAICEDDDAIDPETDYERFRDEM